MLISQAFCGEKVVILLILFLHHNIVFCQNKYFVWYGQSLSFSWFLFIDVTSNYLSFVGAPFFYTIFSEGQKVKYTNPTIQITTLSASGPLQELEESAQ